MFAFVFFYEYFFIDLLLQVNISSGPTNTTHPVPMDAAAPPFISSSAAASEVNPTSPAQISVCRLFVPRRHQLHTYFATCIKRKRARRTPHHVSHVPPKPLARTMSINARRPNGKTTMRLHPPFLTLYSVQIHRRGNLTKGVYYYRLQQL